MSDKYSFRSSMNGFNRSDVINYIEGMITEKVELIKKLSELENEVSRLEKEVSELKNESDTLRNIITDESQKAEAVNMCDDCPVSKKYEARLGAAMLDAKRFSEVLVKEANDKVADTYNNAYNDAEKTYTDTVRLIESINTVNSQMNNSFASLVNNLKNVSVSLDSFKKNIKSNESSYSYPTEFADAVLNNGNAKNEDINVKYGIPNSGVDFDDADEYEIRVDV